jgi:hypothetical protein
MLAAPMFNANALVTAKAKDLFDFFMMDSFKK